MHEVGPITFVPNGNVAVVNLTTACIVLVADNPSGTHVSSLLSKEETVTRLRSIADELENGEVIPTAIGK